MPKLELQIHRRWLRVLLAIGLVVGGPGRAEEPAACRTFEIAAMDQNDVAGFRAMDIGTFVVVYADVDPAVAPGFRLFAFDVRTGEHARLIDLESAPRTTDLADRDGHLTFVTDEEAVPGGNPDGGYEIYRFELASGELTQLTASPATAFNHTSSIAADGTRVVFVSNADHVSGSNPEGNFEVFLYEHGAGLSQVTDTVGERVWDVQLSADGSTVVLLRAVPPFNLELALIDLPSLTTTFITPLQSLTLPPAIDADGDTVVFSATGDLVAGQNPDGNFELYHFDAATASLRQLTHTVSGSSISPSLSADGRRLAFLTSSELASGPSDEFRPLLLDLPTGRLTELTAREHPSRVPAISSDGRRIAYFSQTDPIGTNPDHEWRLFLAECPGLAIVAIPALAPWGAVLLVLALATAAAYRLRRS